MAPENTFDTEDLMDQAINHAKSYWLLGWTFDEIAAVLSDMGYEDDVIDETMEIVASHAERIFKAGPFSNLAINQLIKLTNGHICQVVGSFNEYLNCYDGELEETISVCKEHIDFPASEKLAKAYKLRLEAHNILRNAQQLIQDMDSPEYSGTESVINDYVILVNTIIRKIDKNETNLQEVQTTTKDNTQLIKNIQFFDENVLNELSYTFSEQYKLFGDLKSRYQNLESSLESLKQLISENHQLPVSDAMNLNGLITKVKYVITNSFENLSFNLGSIAELNKELNSTLSEDKKTTTDFANLTNKIHYIYAETTKFANSTREKFPEIDKLILDINSFVRNTYNNITQDKINKSLNTLLQSK